MGSRTATLQVPDHAVSFASRKAELTYPEGVAGQLGVLTPAKSRRSHRELWGQLKSR